MFRIIVSLVGFILTWAVLLSVFTIIVRKILAPRSKSTLYFAGAGFMAIVGIIIVCLRQPIGLLFFVTTAIWIKQGLKLKLLAS